MDNVFAFVLSRLELHLTSFNRVSSISIKCLSISVKCLSTGIILSKSTAESTNDFAYLLKVKYADGTLLNQNLNSFLSIQ